MLVAVAITRSLAVAGGLPLAMLSLAVPIVVSSIITTLVVALAAVPCVDRELCYWSRVVDLAAMRGIGSDLCYWSRLQVRRSFIECSMRLSKDKAGP